MYPFHTEEKVLMLHGTEFRFCLGMAMNTPSSVYKPLYEYRILWVSNSPHLCEICTTLLVVTQHLPLCMVSSFTKHPACLKQHQVWLPTSSRVAPKARPLVGTTPTTKQLVGQVADEVTLHTGGTAYSRGVIALAVAHGELRFWSKRMILPQ
ncbi:hypothetical protein BHE74_00049107 [Ensete ventricosum]|nr:hypothetical protein BHE74_00049107 [Ensete ventricosum]